MRLPAGSVSLAEDRLAAEAGFTGADPDQQTKLLTGLTGVGAQGSVPGFSSIRSAVPSLLTAQSLRASAAAAQQAGCPAPDSAPPANLPAEGSAFGFATTSYLCLRPGYSVTDTAGTTTAVPADVKAWLLVPDGTSTSTATLHLYYSTAAPATGSACVLNSCSSRAAAARQAAAGTSAQTPLDHTPSVWKALGQFYYPSTQVAATAADVFVGRCTGFATSECGREAGEPDSGWQFYVPITIVAGSPSAPADVWITGDIRAEVPVGVIATRRVHVPQIAAPVTGVLTTEAFIAGLGSSTGGASVVGDGSLAGGQVMSWTLTGSLAGAALTPVAGVSSMTVSVSAAGTPPAFVGFGMLPKPVSTQRLTSADVCGTELNNFDTGSVATCRGLW